GRRLAAATGLRADLRRGEMSCSCRPERAAKTHPNAESKNLGGISMTKQATSHPTSDKGAPVAPPLPPAWRHYLWLIALAIFFVLFFILPTTQGQSPVTLNYSQFLHDVSTHEVKTVTIEPSGTATGNLSNKKSFTTAIPPQAGQSLLDDLQKSGVQITAET